MRNGEAVPENGKIGVRESISAKPFPTPQKRLARCNVAPNRKYGIAGLIPIARKRLVLLRHRCQFELPRLQLFIGSDDKIARGDA